MQFMMGRNLEKPAHTTNQSGIMLAVHCSLCLYLLFISSSRAVNCQDDEAPAERLDQLSNFQLSSHVFVFANKDSKTIDAELRLWEAYSNRLERGRLVIKQQDFSSKRHIHSRQPNGTATTRDELPDLARGVSYFSAAHLDKNGKLLKTFEVASETGRKCKLSDQQELAADFFGPELANSATPQLRDWLQLLPQEAPYKPMPSHIFGFARLLLFFELNQRDHFQLMKEHRGAMIRNSAIEQYELKAQREGLKVELSMKFYVKPVGREGSKNLIPFRAWLRLGTGGTELVVDFGSVGSMRQITSDEPSSQPLNLPIGGGCSQVLQEFRALSNPTNQQEVFSFEAQISELWFLKRPRFVSSLFVAYDGIAQAMRVDTLKRHREGDAGAELTTRVDEVTTIHDLNLRRKFRTTPSDSWCLVTEIPMRGKGQESILPMDKLVDMGSGRVRGIEATIYEMVSEQLPKFIFQQVTWTSGDRTQETRFKPKRNAKELQSFTLVYFVGPPPDPRLAGTLIYAMPAKRQLLRLDVYKHEVLLYRVELHNFQWHLSEAPNGEHEDELFSLPDQCHSQAVASGRRLTLELALVSESPELESHYLGADELAHALSLPSERNRALARALSSSSIYASQMRDLRTQLLYEREGSSGEIIKSSIRLIASMKLWLDFAGSGEEESRPLEGQQQVRAVAVASGLPTGPKRPSDQLRTLDECFWAAAGALAQLGHEARVGGHLETGGRAVIFSFCFPANCWIDSEARLVRREGQPEQPQFQSQVFTLSYTSTRRLPCEVLQMEFEVVTRAPEEDPRERRQSLAEVGQNLSDRLLTLTLADSEPLWHKELMFKVARVQSGDADAKPAAAIEGLALSVDDERTEVVELQAGPEAQMSMAESMAGEACHSRCVAKLDCRSYSICHSTRSQSSSRRQAECLTSSLELLQTDLMARLRSELKRARKSARASGRLQVISRWTSEQGAQNETINFNMDKRCQLKAKKATEMFKLSRPEAKSNLYKTHLQPVENQEQCAQMCLRRNIKFFARMAKCRVQLQDVFRSEKPQDLQEQHADSMRYWCASYKFLDLDARPLQESQRLSLRDDLKLLRATKLCYFVRPRWAYTSQQKQTPTTDFTDATREESLSRQTKVPARESFDKTQLISLKMDAYEFVYSSLYKRQQGLRLRGSFWESELLMVSSGTDPSGQQLTINHQLLEEQPPDVEHCARQCFSQASHWCRSFDLIQDSNRFYCVYNSIALQEALAVSERQGFAVVDDSQETNTIAQGNSTAIIQVFHYEPYEAYAIDNVKFKFSAFDQQQQQQTSDGPEGHSSPHWSTILACLLGLITGVPVAYFIEKRYQEKVHAGQHIDHARLSFSLPAAGSWPDGHLLSQDQLELRHQEQERERDIDLCP